MRALLATRSATATGIFNHTVIDPRFRGQGLSQPLIQQALEATHADGLGVIATCSAVVGFVQKNPEFRDYLA